MSLSDWLRPKFPVRTESEVRARLDRVDREWGKVLIGKGYKSEVEGLYRMQQLSGERAALQWVLGGEDWL